MTKTKTEEDATQIGSIATLYNDGQHSCIVLPRSWLGKKVFCVLKEEYDKMKRKEEKENARTVGTFTRALIAGGKQK
jgi:hypothetical protein